MGVQLNIKDPETVRLARKLAGATGRSVTETIRQALEQANVDREAEIAARIAAIDHITERVQRKLTPEMRKITSKEAMDSIYDDGLPA
ncbi:type II toxin-antitoxin system VapB family antitoxin [Sphingomonas rubra]|uniref:Rv0623-like transcription factor n=1 Tax=Sphingomonas rubra TaxID=634430 RepID=A0A1I5SRX9_9SPHN|nr:type II toxin-antitoxin system VapB family antitoxin [Sphingomonas rubra]SFP73391.1 Rv0623-like transcription factor [Sphingomonas rubra]